MQGKRFTRLHNSGCLPRTAGDPPALFLRQPRVGWNRKNLLWVFVRYYHTTVKCIFNPLDSATQPNAVKPSIGERARPGAMLSKSIEATVAIAEYFEA